jgi:hypothetical protein
VGDCRFGVCRQLARCVLVELMPNCPVICHH